MIHNPIVKQGGANPEMVTVNVVNNYDGTMYDSHGNVFPIDGSLTVEKGSIVVFVLYGGGGYNFHLTGGRADLVDCESDVWWIYRIQSDCDFDCMDGNMSNPW